MDSVTLRLVTWNICSGILNSVNKRWPQVKSHEYIAKCLTSLKADLVGLQEVPLPTSAWTFPFADEIADMGGFNHSEVALSPSHLIQGADMGLSILSRYRIVSANTIPLPVPDMTISGDAGERWQLHKKGLLVTKIDLDGREICCISGHLPPFHRMEKGPGHTDFSALWKTLDDTFLSQAGIPTIGLDDCNTPNAITFLPNAISKLGLAATIHEPTRPSGLSHDQIFVSHEWEKIAVKSLPSQFDHYLCLASAVLPKSRPAGKRPSAARREFNAFRLLHLSDLHFGDGSKEDVDWKTFIPHTTREKRRDRLAQFLSSLPERPDYVVVSGDLTIAGRESGFAEFTETIDNLIDRGVLPSVEKIIVVPGNHDVTRTEGGEAATDQVRWKNFAKSTWRFVRPPLPTYSASSKEILSRLREQIALGSEVLGGTWETIDPRLGRRTMQSSPFLANRKDGVALYGFNSAIVSGTKIELSAKEDEAVKSLRRAAGPSKTSIKTVLDALERELWVDPSRVDPQEINLFNEIVSILKDNLDEFDRYVKVAVLHHHVAPVIPEEVAKFEALLNAGRFLKEIAEARFDLVLHGHKHWPGVHMQVWTEERKSQLVISGGTVGGDEGSGTEPGFNWIEVPGDHTKLLTCFVPIRPTGDPRSIVSEVFESKREFPLGDTRRSLSRSVKRMPLRSIFRTTQRNLLSYLRRSEIAGKQMEGWSHALDEDRVSVIATAYGLLILDLIEAIGADVDECVPNVVATLLALKNSDGGWSASSQSSASRPEVTAFVLAGLSKWMAKETLANEIAALEGMLLEGADPMLWNSTYLLSKVAQILSSLKPASAWLPICSDALRAAAYKDGKGRLLYWASHLLPTASPSLGNLDVEASVLHTAHAIMALRTIEIATQGKAGAPTFELSGVNDWLLSFDRWEDVTEDINRLKLDGKYDQLVVKHFTKPWVVLALLMLGVAPQSERLTQEIGQLLASHSDGLWNWGRVQRPIWATYDALLALKESSLASSGA